MALDVREGIGQNGTRNWCCNGDVRVGSARDGVESCGRDSIENRKDALVLSSLDLSPGQVLGALDKIETTLLDLGEGDLRVLCDLQ